MKNKAIKVEWLTLSLILATHCLIAALLFTALPLVSFFSQIFPKSLALMLAYGLVLAGLILLLAFYGSIFHEVLHGHPTNRSKINTALVFPAWGLFFPYFRYRSSHLRHHNDENLTDPYDDPESWYLSARDYRHCPRWFLFILQINNAMLGRIFIGPFLSIYGLLRQEWPYVFHKEPKVAKAWLFHALGLLLVIAVLVRAQFPLWLYVFGAAYPALGLTLIRSFLEHRAHPDQDQRTAIVESSWFFSLLFFNNNLHVVHHEGPQIPWYDLPRAYQQKKDYYLQKNGGYFFASYAQIFKRFAFKPKEPVQHPYFRRED